MKFILLLCGLVSGQNDLCGIWMPATSAGAKCAPAQSCCVESAPQVCSTPITATSATFITQEEYQFAGDSQYHIDFILATGTCGGSINLYDGTVSTVIQTDGTYADGGANTDLGEDWRKLIYTATLFKGTLTKSNKDHFYTPGTTITGGAQVGPCTDITALFNDPDEGCPCNGTWTQETFSTNLTSPATRIINKTACVESNGTSTCPENFFFNTNSRYGSYRVYNNSDNTSRILEITRPSLDNNTGYKDNRTYANFTANFTCPPNTQPTVAPTQSGVGLLAPSAVLLVVTLMWV
jgi:hypothetical protein